MCKKVLFITPSLRQGGVEHSLITVLSNLDLAKYNVTLYLYTDMLDLLPRVPEGVRVIVGVDKTKYFRKPLSVFFLCIINLLRLLGLKDNAGKVQDKMYKYVHKLKVEYPSKKYFSKEEFDVIVSYSLHIGTEMALKINSDRYYVFMHSSDPNYHRNTLINTISYYDKVVCVSEGVRSVYAKAYSEYENKMTVIENYVDAYRVIEKAKDKVEINNDKKLIFCTCGRLSKEKGFDLAVEAAAILKENGIDFIWYFVGDGTEKSHIQSLVEEFSVSDNVFITGYKSNPYPYIKECDIYVQTSYEEAQPLTILEAMILGRPIVSTKTVGGKYILRDGERGVLCDIDSHSMATEILSLLKDRETIEKLTNQYTLHDNDIERQIYIDKWEKLLSQ